MESQRKAENTLTMKIFHTTKCKAYSHEKLNTFKGVIRSRKLVKEMEEDMSATLGKQGIANAKRIIIRPGREKNRNQHLHSDHISKEVKIGFCVERVEKYVPAPFRCFKYQKYGHHRKACKERLTYAKCSEKNPDHMEEDCLKETWCENCRQNHLAYARSCEAYKK